MFVKSLQTAVIGKSVIDHNINLNTLKWMISIYITKICRLLDLFVKFKQLLLFTEQSVQSADSRDSTGRLDKDNVPQTKSVRTRPVFYSMDFFGIGPWTMDQKKYMESMDITEIHIYNALLSAACRLAKTWHKQKNLCHAPRLRTKLENSRQTGRKKCWESHMPFRVSDCENGTVTEPREKQDSKGLCILWNGFLGILTEGQNHQLEEEEVWVLVARRAWIEDESRKEKSECLSARPSVWRSITNAEDGVGWSGRHRVQRSLSRNSVSCKRGRRKKAMKRTIRES